MLRKNEEAGRTVPLDLGHLFPEDAPSDSAEPGSENGKWVFIARQHTRAGDSQTHDLYLPSSKGPRTVNAVSVCSLLGS